MNMVKGAGAAALFILGLAPAAAACSVCATAFADQDLPPIYGWAFLSAGWFLATAFLSVVFRSRVPAIPRFVFSVFIPPLLFIVTGGSVVLFLLLIPWAAIPFFRALFSKRDPFDRRRLRTTIRVLGFTAIAAILVMAIWSHRIRTTRTRAEFIVQWPYTPPATQFMTEMKKEEPACLDEYRYILEHGDGLLASDMAEKIAHIGNPEVDIPLLKSRLEQLQADPLNDSYAEELQAAIAKLEKSTGEPQ